MCRLLMCSLLRCARWGLFLPLLCLLVLLPAATSSASETPATYQITAAELTELQDNLSRLQLINDSLTQALGEQRNKAVDLQTALTEARRRQTALQVELANLKSLSAKQAESLEKANESFRKYAADQKRTRVRIKAQRNTWAAAAGLLAVGFALK